MKEVCILNTNANPNVINIYICWALVCINRLQSWILGTFRGHPQSLFHTKFNDEATQPYLLIFFFIKVLLVKSAQYFRGSGLLHRKSSPQNLFLFLQFKDHFHILAVFLINTVRADPKKKSSLYSWQNVSVLKKARWWGRRNIVRLFNPLKDVYVNASKKMHHNHEMMIIILYECAHLLFQIILTTLPIACGKQS